MALAGIIHVTGNFGAVCATLTRRASEAKLFSEPRLRVGLVWGHV